MWETTQAQFAAAIIEPTNPPPAAIGATRGELSARFGVYRNNFAAGLARALAQRFPATQRIVGEEFFDAMAREFVARRPPASPVLLEYGEGFAEFVENFAPAESLSYLPDVIRLEDARVRAYHAADMAPLDPDLLASVPTDQLAELAFDIHPAATLLRSSHPIVTIWSMNVGEAALAPIDDWRGEDALATRPKLRVFVRRLAPGAARFVQSLMSGATLGDAAREAARETEDFDLAAALAETLNAGVLAAIRKRR